MSFYIILNIMFSISLVIIIGVLGFIIYLNKISNDEVIKLYEDVWKWLLK